MTRLLALALLAAVALPARAVPLFVVAGQSNAAGLAPVSALSGGGGRGGGGQLPSILYFGGESDGASYGAFNRSVRQGTTFGPEAGAVLSLLPELGEDFAIVKFAASATALQANGGTDWSPDSTGELYDRLLAEIAEAQAALNGAGRTAELAGVFWMQGEQDAKSGNLYAGSSPLPQPATADAYGANLAAFIDALRADLGAPALPFFVGEIAIGDDPTIVTNPDSPHNTAFGEWDYTPTIQSAQAGVAAADPHAYLIETDGFTLLDDYLHFDAAGQLALGQAFGRAYLNTLAVPEPATSCLAGAALLLVCGRGLRPR